MKNETPLDRDRRIRMAQEREGVPAEIRRPVEPDEVAKAHAEAVKRLGPGASLNPTEQFIAVWSANEDSIRSQLVRARSKSSAARALRYQLAEVLRKLGRLDEAIELAPKRRAELERLKEALEKADDVDCTCEDYILPVKHPTQPDAYPVKNKRFPRYEIVDSIYSYHHEAVVTLTQCLRCGDWNARATLPSLLAERLSLAAQHPGKNTGSDYDVLPDA